VKWFAAYLEFVDLWYDDVDIETGGRRGTPADRRRTLHTLSTGRSPRAW
jgi:hypothetical protein